MSPGVLSKPTWASPYSKAAAPPQLHAESSFLKATCEQESCKTGLLGSAPRNLEVDE